MAISATGEGCHKQMESYLPEIMNGVMNFINDPVSIELEWPSISKIKNSNKPLWVQYILRHFYYTTMQKLRKFEALSWPKNQCKCHKGNP